MFSNTVVNVAVTGFLSVGTTMFLDCDSSSFCRGFFNWDLIIALQKWLLFLYSSMVLDPNLLQGEAAVLPDWSLVSQALAYPLMVVHLQIGLRRLVTLALSPCWWGMHTQAVCPSSFSPPLFLRWSHTHFRSESWSCYILSNGLPVPSLLSLDVWSSGN